MFVSVHGSDDDSVVRIFVGHSHVDKQLITRHNFPLPVVWCFGVFLALYVTVAYTVRVFTIDAKIQNVFPICICFFCKPNPKCEG